MKQALENIRAICAGEVNVIANMATIACELYHGDARFDWVGFYRNIGNATLKIGPYQGGHGCLTIPFSKGVCGAAARERRVVVVDDVNGFDGHIACASSTISEIVLPVFGPDGGLLGVLDIDSNQPAAFTQADAMALETLLHDIFATGQKPS
jgi:GAF domain-containing protein